MTVTIKLFASFQRGRLAIEVREYPEATTVAEIARDLHIPAAEIGVVLVNGRHVTLDDRPAAGDVLAFFPVIGGG
jgi:sulfur carrier protein ThiS